MKVAPDIRTLISQIVQFASIYQAKQALIILQKQRFVEWFSGDDIDLIWNKRTQQGDPGVFGMVDAVDEGFFVRSGSPDNSHAGIDFNAIRHYSETACEIIGVCRITTTPQVWFAMGGINDANQKLNISTFHSAIFHVEDGNTNFVLRTGDASTNSDTAGSVAKDTSFHVGKVICGSANIKLDIDGVLDVTKTTNRPGARLQPIYQVATQDPGTREGHIRYLEAYNT